MKACGDSPRQDSSFPSPCHRLASHRPEPLVWPIFLFFDTLAGLGVAADTRIVSAHRTPDRLFTFAKGAKTAGYKVIIAGAGGAAHLPGMAAALTELPVFGVPIESRTLKGIDSLYSIVQMPAGIPVGTLAIGKAGAINAALLAAAVLALSDPALSDRLAAWRKAQTEAVAERPEDKA
jgi:5-(carboxyamino)imidazole ribonucleotide mutase